MSLRKRIQPGEPIGLKLTLGEREMIQELPMVEPEIAQRVATAPKDQPNVPFTLDELDDLIGHIAAEANHTGDRQKQRRLDRLYEKIDRMLKSHTDQPEAEEKGHLVEAAQPINLSEWAHFMLDLARRGGVATDQYHCKVMLSPAQRRTILELEVNDEIRQLLSVKAEGPRTFNFTAEELGKICHALAGALSVAQGHGRNQILKTAEKIAQGLTEGLTTKKKRRPRTTKKTAFQLRITLQDVKTVVWRQFQVLDCTLPEFHEVIQAVMGWQNSHLYRFEVGGIRYSDPSLSEDLECADGRRIKLSHLVKQGHRQFEYVYDFGDRWRHRIEVESVFQPEEKAKFPVCIEGAGTCPPEDVGGEVGYEEFLRAINDPNDADHQHYLDWCGGWFDPDAFDLALVNRTLRKRS
jgi:hypothetical protein